MTVALYINEGRQQVVLTPENEWERNICKTIAEGKKDLGLYFGQFTDVQGGWTMRSPEGYRGKDKDSLIIVLDKPAQQ